MADSSLHWHTAAKNYLTRLAHAEWISQGKPIPKRKNSKRYVPSDYYRSLMECLNRNDEQQFKAIKMLEGYASAIGV